MREAATFDKASFLVTHRERTINLYRAKTREIWTWGNKIALFCIYFIYLSNLKIKMPDDFLNSCLALSLNLKKNKINQQKKPLMENISIREI